VDRILVDATPADSDYLNDALNLVEALVLAGLKVDSLPEGELKSAYVAILRLY